MGQNSIFDFVDHIFYINLERRTDRRKTAEIELRKVDLDLKNITRFEAVDAEKLNITPQRACAMSHTLCVKIAKQKKYKNVLIFEDDFFFNQDIETVIKDFKDFFDYINNDYNFFLLGTYNNFKFEKVSHKINRVIQSHSTTGYIINSTFYDEWIEVCEDNLRERERFVPVDNLWLMYQGVNGKSYTTNTNQYRLVRQYDGYSDITKTYRKLTW